MPELTVGLLLSAAVTLLASVPLLLVVAFLLFGLALFCIESPKKAAILFCAGYLATVLIVILVRWIIRQPDPPPLTPRPDEQFTYDVNTCRTTCEEALNQIACNNHCIEAAKNRLKARSVVVP